MSEPKPNTGEPTRWSFPAARPEDPARALADLRSTPDLVEDVIGILQDFMVDIAGEAISYARVQQAIAELRNLQRRLESIAGRLT